MFALKAKLLALGAGLVALALIAWRIYRAGQQSIVNKVNSKTLKSVIKINRERRKVDEDVRNLSDSDLVDELLDGPPDSG